MAGMSYSLVSSFSNILFYRFQKIFFRDEEADKFFRIGRGHRYGLNRARTKQRLKS